MLLVHTWREGFIHMRYGIIHMISCIWYQIWYHSDMISFIWDMISFIWYHSYDIRYDMISDMISFIWDMTCRPTQSIMYVPLQVNRSQKSILLIVQYKYLKSCSGDFYSPESDPPHKIMRYCVYYSTQLCFGCPPDRICQVETICIGGVPVLKRHFGGAGP